MAFLGESREKNDSPWHIYVCLGQNDCKVLVNSVKALVKCKEKNYNHYKEIHESGEATDSQTDKMFEAGDDHEIAVNIMNTIEDYLNVTNKE